MIESVTVIRNPVKHDKKAFLAMPRKPDVWDEKRVLHLRIDSAQGREELGAPLVSYPEDYLRAVHGWTSQSAPEYGSLSGWRGIFRFQRRGGELVLERIWPGWYEDDARDPKVCWESPPDLDSLEVE